VLARLVAPAGAAWMQEQLDDRERGQPAADEQEELAGRRRARVSS